MLVWRLVKNGMATLTELETTWSIDDVLRANAVLDMVNFIDKKESDKIGKQGKAQ